MIIRKATYEDLDKIMKIVDENRAAMLKEENTQWDDGYPAVEHFTSDIDNGVLYAAEDEGELLGVICLNEVGSEGYSHVHWRKRGSAIVIHRMNVSPTLRHKGVGRQLVEFGENLAREKGLDYIKADTYCENHRMMAFLKKCGFEKAGEIYLRNKPNPFHCFEKLL
ncbi:MAG: GNAT family N-acetyltransferase [Clostridioides sp.]|nr:GNAT family N-acetyltransferase [Clostridioides sp.]